MKPVRRLIKTELALPRTRGGKLATLVAMTVGGLVAAGMVALFTAFLVETFRRRG